MEKSPVLRANIDAIVNSQIPDKSGTFLFVIVSVRNSGTPTSLEDWQLSAKLLNGTEHEGKSSYIPKVVTLEGEMGKLNFTDADALYNKTIDTPLVNGAMVRGLLWYRFDDLDVSAFRQAGTSLILSFKDVLGTLHRHEMSVSGISGKAMYLPGLTKPSCDNS